MTLQTSQPVLAPVTREGRLTQLMQVWRARTPEQRRTFRLVALLGLLALGLDAGVVALSLRLFRDAGRSAHSEAQPLAVPYAHDSALWEPLRRWSVQEDGRIKPFDTFSREAVRAVTGREEFESNDAVAVAASWLLASDAVDWEHTAFILCDNLELRELIYRDQRGPSGALSDQDRHGRHLEPALLRASPSLARLARAAAQASREGKSSPPTLESQAAEVSKRLALFDHVHHGGRNGPVGVHAPGEFAVVALDRHGSMWFSLRDLRELNADPSQWAEALRLRRYADPSAYANGQPQEFPEADTRAVASAALALELAYQSGDRDRFAAAQAEFLAVVERVNSPSHPEAARSAGLELWYNRSNPFRLAWICGGTSCLLLTGALLFRTRGRVVGRVLYTSSLLALAASLSWAGAGFVCRVAVSGRPPVGNMYESLVWVAFATAALGLVLELMYRKRVLALAGGLVSTIGFVLADQLPLTFTPNIQPLQAVLRSNTWLMVHVLTIVSAYAAFALAWGLGNLNLALMLAFPRQAERVRALSDYCYRAIQVGVVLLAAGTLLGACWAAESWGRFWGWDPKEVWALVALLCYLIPLHARHVGWVHDFGLAVCAVLCFSSVVMAWYGVNFILGTGLHAYGFGNGNDLWVYWVGLTNVALVAHAAVQYYASTKESQQARSASEGTSLAGASGF